MSRHCLISPAIAGLACIAPSFLTSVLLPACADVSTSFYTGVEATTGDFDFEEDTTVERLPIGASMTTGRLTIFVEAAYLHADGYVDAIQQSVASGYTGRLSRIAQLRGRQTAEPISASEPAQQTVSGWGDALLGASLRLAPAPSNAYAGLSVSATAPTGEEDTGLGAGEWTYAASLDGEKRWNAFFLRASGGGLMGETSKGAQAFASIGAGYDLTSRITSTLSLSWAQSPDDFSDDTAETALSAGISLPGDAYLSAYVLTGLTEVSPDIGGGITLSIAR